MNENRPQVSFAGLMVPSLLSLAGAIYVGLQYGPLPAIVPTHFNGAGAVDGFGPKSQLWVLPAIAIILNIVLAGANMLVVVKPSAVNLPVRLTLENRGRVLDLAFRMLVYMRWILNILFAGLMVCMVGGAKTGTQTGIGMIMIPSLVLLFGGLFGYIVAMRRAA